MCRVMSFGCFVVVVASIAAFAAPGAAVGGTYRFDKIADTTEFYRFGAQTVPSISENGGVTYRLEGITTPDKSYMDLSEFDIPLDDSGPYRFFQEPAINSHGDAVFFAGLHGGGNVILFWSDNQVSTVVDQTGIFQSISTRNSINNHGDVLFGATVDAMPGAARLYIWNDGIIESVVGAGDVIDGITILNTGSVSQSALNDSRQIAFNILFEDETRAIYRATPVPVPEPSTGAALLVGAALLTLLIRRHRKPSSLNLH